MDIINVVGFIVGIVSLALAIVAMRQSAADLRAATAELKGELHAVIGKLDLLLTIQLNALEDAGIVKLNRDESGRITGRTTEQSIGGELAASGDLEVHHIPAAPSSIPTPTDQPAES